MIVLPDKCKFIAIVTVTVAALFSSYVSHINLELSVRNIELHIKVDALYPAAITNIS